MQYFSQSFAIKVKARAHWAFVSTFLLAVAFTKVEKVEIENWFSKTKARSGGKRLALRNHTNNNFSRFDIYFDRRRKKRSKNFAHFHFSNFPCFSPPINHVAPIVVFASGICFLVGGIFPPLLFLHCTSTTYLYQQLTDLFQSIALDSTILQALMKYISLFDSCCFLCIIILT